MDMIICVGHRLSERWELILGAPPSRLGGVELATREVRSKMTLLHAQLGCSSPGAGHKLGS